MWKQSMNRKNNPEHEKKIQVACGKCYLPKEQGILILLSHLSLAKLEEDSDNS